MPTPVYVPRPPDPVRAATAQLARAVKAADAEAETAARQLLAELKIRDYVLRCLSTSPPLTAEARQRLAELLTGGVR